MLEEWGVQADAKRRALRKLEMAGLITVERRGKRSPHVTLLVKDFGACGAVPTDVGLGTTSL